ncbi:hypothetical protein VT06_16265 [Arsukibacterium sp. MJ3]|uniref:ABC transporter permease n=1 Tax=Arsukibacterium sp. MJ3 TaxID=1632859 RepID=UPI00062710CE|nr:FtsX-like permease family protein [Arsukibacterium sp. MJ3]KKO47577.1 hypothetical protein VT06_16265 [Arsukibacterium sp. MJ3]
MSRIILAEAIVISAFGGLIGILLGIGSANAIAFAVPNFPSAHVPNWAIGVSFVSTFFIGIIFGLAPAIKASKLNPIEALRCE